MREVFSDLQLCEQTSADQVVERLQGAQVAISNKILLNAQTLAACPDLKLILIAATGTNNVDLAAARAQGITVSNCQATAHLRWRNIRSCCCSTSPHA